MSDFMIFKSFLNKKEIPFQPISLNSFSSKINLMISSTNGITGILLLLLTSISIVGRYLVQLPNFSLESTFTINFAEAIYCSIKLLLLILFYFRYNQRFLDETIASYRAIDVDHDHQTRKYYWTRRAVYKILIILSYTIRLYYPLVIYKYSWPYQSKEQALKLYSISVRLSADMGNYWTAMLATSIGFSISLLHDLALIDLIILTQSALHYINNQVTLISEEMNIEGAKLDYKVIKTLRWQYLLVYRLVDKLSLLMNLCIFGLIIYYMNFLIFCIYALAFDDPILPIRICTIMQTLGILIALCLFTHSIVTVFTKSQESLSMLYKLSFETESFQILNEISLFLYRIGFNDVGFSFGGIFMITPDFISTLAIVTVTVIIAIPSFMASSK